MVQTKGERVKDGYCNGCQDIFNCPHNHIPTTEDGRRTCRLLMSRKSAVGIIEEGDA